ncbi:uncharacterized protein [Nicotiana sylvestris]|uniref:uncharacterized protein n=1 Tax=Nicotiana sylvestris TaxID=4096 RepID=UPI00388C693C
MDSVAFLGHVVSGEGIKVDLKKIEAVHSWPKPTSATKIRSFSGWVGYYHRFMEGFSSVPSPLIDLTQKGKANMMADVLEPGRVLTCVVAQSSLLEHIKARQFDYINLLLLKDTMQEGGAKKVVIEDDSVMRLQGVTKMYHDLKQHYWWRKMNKDIVGHVSWCLNCQHVKYEHQKPSGLTQRLVIPEWKWERITMDFVSSIQTASYEALYGRLCCSPIGWFETGEANMLDIDLVRDSLEKVNLIQDRLQTTQSRQKSYADKKAHDVAYMEDEKVILKLSPMRGVMSFENKGKFSLKFIGPFEIYFYVRLRKNISFSDGECNDRIASYDDLGLVRMFDPGDSRLFRCLFRKVENLNL